jgi:outer membrane protein OmpU
MIKRLLKSAACVAASAWVAGAAYANGDSGVTISGTAEGGIINYNYQKEDLGNLIFSSDENSDTNWEVRASARLYGLLIGTSDEFSFSSGTPSVGDHDGVDADFFTDVNFNTQITLDNGLTFGGSVDLEALADDDQDDNDIAIDEAFIFVRGSFGSIVIGAQDSAGYDMHVSAPNLLDNTITGYDEGFAYLFGQTGVNELEGDVFRHTLGTTRVENESFNEGVGITYFTPRFAGFQLGVSYARDGDHRDDRDDCEINVCNFFSVGANYAQDYGAYQVAVSARYDQADAPSNASSYYSDVQDPTTFGFGGQIGFGGFVIGGSWAETQEVYGWEGESYDVGASYSTAPWTFSATYFHGESGYSDTTGSGMYTSSYADNAENDAVQLSLSYELAQGVKLNAYGMYVDYEDTYNSQTGTSSSSSSAGMEGFVIGTGIALGF